MRAVQVVARWMLGVGLVLAALQGYLEVYASLVLSKGVGFTTPAAAILGALICTLSLVAGCLLCASSRLAWPVACLALLPQAFGFAGGSVSYAMIVGADWGLEIMARCVPFICLPDGHVYSPPSWHVEFQLRTDRDYVGVGLRPNFAALLQLACVFALSRQAGQPRPST